MYTFCSPIYRTLFPSETPISIGGDPLPLAPDVSHRSHADLFDIFVTTSEDRGVADIGAGVGDGRVHELVVRDHHIARLARDLNGLGAQLDGTDPIGEIGRAFLFENRLKLPVRPRPDREVPRVGLWQVGEQHDGKQGKAPSELSPRDAIGAGSLTVDMPARLLRLGVGAREPQRDLRPRGGQEVPLAHQLLTNSEDRGFIEEIGQRGLAGNAAAVGLCPVGVELVGGHSVLTQMVVDRLPRRVYHHFRHHALEHQIAVVVHLLKLLGIQFHGVKFGKSLPHSCHAREYLSMTLQETIATAESLTTCLETLFSLYRDLRHVPEWHRSKIRKKIVGNPNISAKLVPEITHWHGRELFKNPVLPLLLMETPDLFQRANTHNLYRLLSWEETPKFLLNVLSQHQNPLIAHEAQYHVGVHGEYTDDSWIDEVKAALYSSTCESQGDKWVQYWHMCEALPRWLTQRLSWRPQIGRAHV